MFLFALYVLTFLQPCLSYNEDYKGFNSCGTQGWSCMFTPQGYETSYNCNATSDKNARIWVWTARIPSSTTIFTIRDCNTVEIHFDCTKGYRAYNYKEFRAINIKKLVIVKPLAPGSYLHDNDRVYHAPAGVYFKDIGSMIFPSFLLNNPTTGNCKYKNVNLTTLVMDSVRIEELDTNAINNQEVQSVTWKNVTVARCAPKAINMKGNFKVSHSHLLSLPGSALTIEGEKVEFSNNYFLFLEKNSIASYAAKFEFINNTVGYAGTEAFKVVAKDIQFVKNKWISLTDGRRTMDKKDVLGAFQSLSPGFTPKTFEFASKFVFNFSDNIIEDVGDFALDMNATAYYNICSTIVIQHNILHCNCNKLNWLNGSKEFVKDLFLPENNNRCYMGESCGISQFINQNTSECFKTRACAFTDYTDTDSLEMEFMTEKIDGEQRVDLGSDYGNLTAENVDEFNKSYLENRITESPQRVVPIWLIVTLTLITIFAAAGMVYAYTWAMSRKREGTMRSMYCSNDADAVRLVNEM